MQAVRISTTDLQQFFKAYDHEGKKSADRESFRQLCNRFDISNQDADIIFDDLDYDHDGMMSFEDFTKGVSDFMMAELPAADAESQNGGDISEPVRIGEEFTRQHVWSELATEDEGPGKNTEEGRLKWLLEELQSSEKKHLVPYLENAVEQLLANLQRLQEENEKLEKSWKREKEEHDKHLKRMEEEIDSQVKETEMKLRMQAQAEVEKERKSLQSRMDQEMNNLQTIFDKVNSCLQNQPSGVSDSRLDEVKNKLNEAVNENRQLRMSIRNTQTSIALMRSELLQMKSLYEEKFRELSNDRERILEVLQEQDHLTQQMSLLHDANKRLQDINDALRSSADLQNTMSKKKKECTHGIRKRGSIIGDYIDNSYTHIPTTWTRENDEESTDFEFEHEKNLRRVRSMDLNFPVHQRRRKTERKIAPHSLSQPSNGTLTTRDLQDHDEGFFSTPESSLVREDDRVDQTLGILTSTPVKVEATSSTEILCNTQRDSGLQDSCSSSDEANDGDTSLTETVESSTKNDELPKKKISEIVKQLGIQDTLVGRHSFSSWRRQKLLDSEKNGIGNGYKEIMSPPQPLPRRSLNPKFMIYHEQQDPRQICDIDRSPSEHIYAEINKKSIISPRNSVVQNGVSSCESLLSSVDEDIEFTPDGPAEQIFTVIFVGDAGVGKSSFALRISKGVFMRHMSSTLGVDFLMRSMRVDGHNFEIHLWDTAGQERFRSVTTSYFRRADGVMLLYDCTCEKSFLNVRQWVKDVDVSCFYRLMANESSHREKSNSVQKIPLMIVANKIDLRDSIKSGKPCITTEQGEKLSAECGAAFIEASAKDGTNVLRALADLVRCMSENRDIPSYPSTIQLCEGKEKKSGCCKK